MPFDNDGVITWELMVERLNSELANTLGNLVNRTISMSNKYFGGVVENKGVAEAVDDDLKNTILEETKKVDAKMNDLRVADAITEILTSSRDAINISTRQCRGRLPRMRPRRTDLRPCFIILLKEFR